MKNVLVGIGALAIALGAHASPLSEAIDADYEYLDALFKHLHANPELSMQEFKTSDRMATEMEALGFEVTRNIGKTGVVGLMRNGDGPTLMIRADMDGLPVGEKTGLDYASNARQVNLDGEEMPVMHACGHDMHMTSLIGTARRMVELKDRWQGTLMLVAQPAEEAIGGALAMVADNIYEQTARPDFALALHVEASGEAGIVSFSDGLMYSGVDTVYITVQGVGTHGASPHLGKDPILVGSQIVVALQSIVTREISPIEPSLITVGSFHGGTAPNVIGESARLEITVRYNRPETRRVLLDAIERVAVQTAKAAGLPDDRLPIVEIDAFGSAATINDSALAQRVRNAMQSAMGADRFTRFEQKDMGAEDFPDLVNVDPPIPSVYFKVGGTPAEDLKSGNWAGHHSPLFQIDPESSIKAGVEAMTVAALDLLAPPAAKDVSE